MKEEANIYINLLRRVSPKLKDSYNKIYGVDLQSEADKYAESYIIRGWCLRILLGIMLSILIVPVLVSIFMYKTGIPIDRMGGFWYVFAPSVLVVSLISSSKISRADKRIRESRNELIRFEDVVDSLGSRKWSYSSTLILTSEEVRHNLIELAKQIISAEATEKYLHERMHNNANDIYLAKSQLKEARQKFEKALADQLKVGLSFHRGDIFVEAADHTPTPS